ncbi:uncharacterized protein LOC124637211 [Helicoverpa zea]|uniref:uncharacterized protein LOC124637211 n=1 Tax=Helicoverpa zea TaxID=7113 RepID=UPI001F58A5B9|nr:uncharacterized protein LOC124637211 [Helicoverpa zea]
MFTSEKNPYLPPEAHTPVPYFQMNGINKLPFPYLPPTATKAPISYPSPFPMIMSTTIRPSKIDDDDEDEDEKSTTQISPHLQNKFNRTERMTPQKLERRAVRPVPKIFHNPIDRIDTKLPFQFNSNPEPATQGGAMPTMAPRSISIMDIRDHNMDQIKAASFPGAQYVPQPGNFISSTTETAIPILRLSNEMDLDGSFSYEALGADQTHYVQHSRMENLGTGKDEQVVEGSYSYVGDNGKTYTVHYIADVNGFRASGDHLPVAPPIPEIIQRAIQYNLAEESKKPPHLKSWNEEQQENELSESEKRQQFAVSPPRLSSLFTGKTPESFSHSFSQPPNTQNNLVAAASSQSPVQANIDYSDQMQNKQNSGTISPQITFLASQGAHVPSANAPQQTINRMFTTEKSAMPQLVNYEANMKANEQENNKALWRWQYGINANANQNMEKNSISRSFGADDIVINFNDMTSEQYTKMLTQHLEPDVNHHTDNKKHVQSVFVRDSDYYSDDKSSLENNYQGFNDNLAPEPSDSGDENQYSTVVTVTNDDEEFTNRYDTERNNLQSSVGPKQFAFDNDQTSRPKLITQQQFVPKSQTVTQTYDYEDDDNFESRKTKILNAYDSYDMNLTVLPLTQQTYKTQSINDTKITTKMTVSQETPTSPTQETSPSPPSPPSPPSTTTTYSTTMTIPVSSPFRTSLRFTDFIVPENRPSFKPLFKFTEPPEISSTTQSSTTESNIRQAIEENIFLKNLLRSNPNKYEVYNRIREENHIKNLHVRPHQPKPPNEIKTASKKPVDIADILNYISRSHFESNKLKLSGYKGTYSAEEDELEAEENKNRNYRNLPEQKELQGVIKNYKVLNRNNNLSKGERYVEDGLKRNLSPPPLKPVSLPPLGRAGPSMKSYLPPVYV